MPADAAGYTVNLADEGKTALGLTDDDPIVTGLAEYAAKNGKPQGYVDDVLEAAAELAKAGLFDSGFDPKAETEKLGENADGRRREVELFGESLKARGEIDDEEFGELMSLSPTAAGVSLIEKLRKRMTDQGKIVPPTGGDTNDAEAAKTKAREMAADPKYQNDRTFRREADKAWAAAFGGRV